MDVQRPRIAWVLTAFLFVVGATNRVALAARGDLVASVTFSQNCTSGLGVGIAFDGVNLWYSCYGGSPDLLRANATTGQVTASYTIANGLGALAYDSTRNAIWAGWGGPNSGAVYLIQLDKNGNVQSSALKFTASNAAINNIDDGLAFDAQDDTLYISADTSTTIHHYSTNGGYLGGFSWAGSGCYNSGLAIGGNLLYEGSDGCSRVWVVDKAAPATGVFNFSTIAPGDPNFRDEDLECDIFTFASLGKHVMWSKEAYPPMRAHAFEIDFGSCGVGGLPALSSAADLARKVVGTAYLWGGKGWDWSQQKFVDYQDVIAGYKYSPSSASILPGVDCSGLVFWAYNKSLGAKKYQSQPNPVFYEGADGQFHFNSQPVNEADLRAGDLLFFDWNGDGRMDHVTMYAGGDDVVNAKGTNYGIILSQKSALKALAGFAGFRRVTTPVVYFQVRTHSPVSLVVSDPDGFTIDANTHIITETENLREVPGQLYYSAWGVNADGSIDEMVSSPWLKNGAYLIGVVPKPGVSPTQVYGLEIETPAGVITLAQNAPISQIPEQGYGIAIAGSNVAQFIPIKIDIKPGEVPNSINLGSKGTVPVAVLASNTFDARTVDPSSISFAGAPVVRSSIEDVNHDGKPDLVVHVNTADLKLTAGDTQAVLVGKTFSGMLIRGVDNVRVVPQ